MYAILSQKTVFTGNVFAIIQQEVDVGGGKIKIFEKAVRSPGVRLIIVDQSQQQILFTKEYRQEIAQRDIRLPGGKVFDHQSEYRDFIQNGGDIQAAVIQAAQREAQEETGIQSAMFSCFAKSVVGATVERDLYYVIVSDAFIGTQELESGEYISSGWYSFDEAKEFCLSGEISEERSAMMILRYLSKA